MSTENTNTTTDNTKQENDRPVLIKKIGRTTCQVHIHFSITSTESMSDKIKRMRRMRLSRCSVLEAISKVKLF